MFFLCFFSVICLKWWTRAGGLNWTFSASMKMNFLCQILSEKSCIFDRFFGTFWITNLGIFWVRKLELFLDLIFSFYAEFRREIDTRPFFVGQFLDRNCPQFLGHFLCNFGDFFSDIFWTFFEAKKMTFSDIFWLEFIPPARDQQK